MFQPQRPVASLHKDTHEHWAPDLANASSGKPPLPHQFSAYLYANGRAHLEAPSPLQLLCLRTKPARLEHEQLLGGSTHDERVRPVTDGLLHGTPRSTQRRILPCRGPDGPDTPPSALGSKEGARPDSSEGGSVASPPSTFHGMHEMNRACFRAALGLQRSPTLCTAQRPARPRQPHFHVQPRARRSGVQVGRSAGKTCTAPPSTRFQIPRSPVHRRRPSRSIRLNRGHGSVGGVGFLRSGCSPQKDQSEPSFSVV